MAADDDPALDAAETLLMIPDLLHYWLCGHARRRVHERDDDAVPRRRAPAPGPTTCSSASTCRRGCCPRWSQPGTRARRARGRRRRGDRPRHADRRRRRDARHRLGGRRDAVPRRPARPTSAPARGRSSASRSPSRVIDRRDLRREPHERGRRRRHLPAAAQRHRALAAARVPPRLGARRARALASTSWSRSPSGAGRCARSSTRTTRRSPTPGDMPARIRDVLRARPARREPADAGAVARCILESLALKHAETVDLLASVTGVAPAEIHIVGGGARNELLCRWTAAAAGLPVLAGPEEATLLGNLLVQAIALGEIGSVAEAREVVRASFAAARPRAGGSSALARGAGSASPRSRCRAEVTRMSEALGVLHGIPAPEDRWDPARPTGSTPLDALAYRSNLLGADRALANIGGGNTSAKGTVVDHAGRETPRALGQGLRHRPRDDHARPASPSSASTRCCRCANGRRWTTRRWSTTSCAARSRPDQPRPSIETLLHAFVAGAAGRPHAPRRGHRAHLVAGRTRARRGGVRRRGRLARLPAARASTCRAGSRSCSTRTRPRARCCSRSTGSSPGARRGEESYRATIEFVARAAQAIERAAAGRLRARRREGRASSGTTRPTRLLVARAPRAPRRAARRRRRRRSSRSTAARRRSRSPRRRARPR